MPSKVDANPSDRAPAPSPARKPSQAKPTQYFLLAYNFTSAILWSTILGRVLLIASVFSPLRVHFATGRLLQWTQTLALSEVVFALTGLVRAPVSTTVMQVSSRLLLVWGILFMYPGQTVGTSAYITMLVAWSVTEVVRYGFFAAALMPGGSVPASLRWARYNFFFVLYPLGIYSECRLIYETIPAARLDHPLLEYVLWGILAIYVPGSYILYSHMMTQRRKVIRAARATDKTR